MNEQFERLIQQLMERGYGVVDDFISFDLIQKLRKNLEIRFENDELRLAGIGKSIHYQKDEAYRNDLISWLDHAVADSDELIFLSLIEDFIDYLNRTCFTALRTYEIHYALYQKGSFYKRHLDVFQIDSGRKFSVICYLNGEWTTDDGGELVLYLEDETIKILPKGGRIVFFKSDELEHEVLPAKQKRMSLTGWLKT